MSRLLHANFRGKDTTGHARRYSVVSWAKMAEPIEMPFGLWTRIGPKKHLLHWHNLANTIESSMCGGDAAFLSNYFDHLFYIFVTSLRILTLFISMFFASMVLTRHRASTSMYSLTFCVRIMLPERRSERQQCMEARSPDCRCNAENAPPVDT